MEIDRQTDIKTGRETDGWMDEHFMTYWPA